MEQIDEKKDLCKGKKQLIVMGNGFDLLCGLKTTYDCFFDKVFGLSVITNIWLKYLRKVKHEELGTYEWVLNSKVRPEFKKYIVSYVKNNIGKIDNLNQLIINARREFIIEMDEKYLKKLKGKISDKQYTNYSDELDKLDFEILNPWLVVALGAFIYIDHKSSIKWCDVETIIYKVVTWVLKEHDDCVSKVAPKRSKKPNVYVSVEHNLAEKTLDEGFARLFEDCLFSGNNSLGQQELSQQKFRQIIENCFYKDDKSIDEKAIEMLNALVDFEHHFSDFINGQTGTKNISDETDQKSKYYCKARELIEKIVYPDLPEKNFYKNTETNIDVLNFNYSLDERFENYLVDNFDPRANLKINSWSNIHGVACYDVDSAKKEINDRNDIQGTSHFIDLPAPIFGIDNHDILDSDKDGNMDFDDPRSIFTKSFRLMDNHINSIRNNTFQKDIDVITFIGHSLSHADYSYFESIFDQYDIFHSDVKLEFYYYKGNSEEEARKNEREVMRKVVNLLTSYGLTLRNEHGENIINKMMLEQRLTIIRSLEEE